MASSKFYVNVMLGKMKMSKQLELANELAEMITDNYEDYVTGEDILDYLASLDLRLVEDIQGDVLSSSSIAYLKDLNGSE